VSEIYHQVQSAVSQPVHYACSKAVVTLFAASNFRPIQIMTKYLRIARTRNTQHAHAHAHAHHDQVLAHCTHTHTRTPIPKCHSGVRDSGAAFGRARRRCSCPLISTSLRVRVSSPHSCAHTPPPLLRDACQWCPLTLTPLTIKHFNIIYQLASMASMWWRFPGNTNYDPPNHCCRGAYFYLDGGGSLVHYTGSCWQCGTSSMCWTAAFGSVKR
jgi:hypothetical protein